MDLAKIPNTRAEAKVTGATHYFTGKPCKQGHIAPRLTKGTCVVCRELEWKQSNEKRKHQLKSEAAKAAGRRYYERNKDLVKQRASLRDKEAARESKRKWAEANKEQRRIYTNTRRRRLRNATPKWLTKEQKAEIRAIYEKAARWSKETGERYVVDHVIPLQAPNVCGLHVPENLQVITHSLNVKKGFKFNPG